jgi:hypothetical protein
MDERLIKAVERIADSLEGLLSLQIKQTSQSTPEKIAEMATALQNNIMKGLKHGNQ